MYSKVMGICNSDPFLNIDKNGTIRTATAFDHEIDSNLTITIRAIDDDGFSIDKNFKSWSKMFRNPIWQRWNWGLDWWDIDGDE